MTDNILLYQSTVSIVLNGATSCIVSNNQGYQKVAGNAVNFIDVLTGSNHNTFIGNSAYGPSANSWQNGILAQTGTDYCNFIGNIMPSACVGTPFNLNLSSNTHSVQLGTTG